MGMDDRERVEGLRKVLAPVIAWYKQVEEDGEPDSSYLYDETEQRFAEKLRAGDFQAVIELLK